MSDDDNRPPDDRERRNANLILLAIAIAFVAATYWLFEAMFAQKQRDDCVARGGRDCTSRIERPQQ